MLHSHKALLTVLFLQATISISTSTTSSNQDIVKRLNQITQKLEELDTKLSSCSKTSSKCQKVPKSCADIYNYGHKQSGVYKIDPDGKGLFSAFCDQSTDGGGWTVIQRRMDGRTDFYRGWSDYKHGFGDLKRSYWLGLDKIYRLTHQETNELRVDLQDWNGKTTYAKYSLFRVAAEFNNYKLTLGTYSGTAGDSLSYHRGMAFSTKDRDNDKSGGSCAQTYKGGWWYNRCYWSNLDGLYQVLGMEPIKGIDWTTFKGYHYSNEKAVMMIRPGN